MKWEIKGRLGKGKGAMSATKVVEGLLRNRGITTKKAREEFFSPKHPEKLGLKDLGISKTQMEKAVRRIKKAVKSGEKIIVFGDYDADGVMATAIMWEALWSMGGKAMPYIPDRFSEGYGISEESVEKLKKEDNELGLIITVDNGVVAHGAVKKAKKMGIDVIITDHHEKEKKYPEAVAVVHTTITSGSAIAWVVGRELGESGGLDLVAVGTLADMLPLVGVNRSFVKWGLESLNETERLGPVALFEQAGIERGGVGAYHIGFVIGPRINAMGRLEHAMDALRLVCTKDEVRARDLAVKLGNTNKRRQEVVEQVVMSAERQAKEREWEGIIVISGEDYHEGVIGLAAARLVERYFRPAVVFSKGEEYSKASARSIKGLNIIEVARKTGKLLVKGGGHEMAAGFTVKTKDLEEFEERLNEIAMEVLTEEILERRLKVDFEIGFSAVMEKLPKALRDFEPVGMGNPTPVFATRGVEVMNIKAIGRDNRHVKMVLKHGRKVFEAIGFGMGELLLTVEKGQRIDIAYNIEENVWNGVTSLQLKLKDVKVGEKEKE